MEQITPEYIAFSCKKIHHPAFLLALRQCGERLKIYDKRIVEITLDKKDEPIADWMIENEADWLDEFSLAFGEHVELEFEIEEPCYKEKSPGDYFIMWLEDELSALDEADQAEITQILSTYVNDFNALKKAGTR